MKIAAIILFSLLTAGCSQTTGDVTEIAAAPFTVAISPTPSPAEPEQDWKKAVRLAEEFIARNGYTDAPADKDNLTLESIEFESDVDKMLADRKGSLQPKAYGYRAASRMNQKGWTVVFRYNRKSFMEKMSAEGKRLYEKTGRAVTMNENFEDMRVEHKAIFLDGVGKKLEP